MDEKTSKETSSERSNKQLDGLSVDWELANASAAEWARLYGSNLVNNITGTTLTRLQNEIAAFIENGENMGQLRARLEPLFGPERADLIASTEVTRAYAEGNMTAWRESGIIQRREWRTNNDEIVAECPICFPMNGVQAGMDEPFEHPTRGAIEIPGHPRCRCWLVPVVEPPEL